MKPIVIKCGGSVFETLPEAFFQDITHLQQTGCYFPIIVHGGGPVISKLLTQLNIPNQFQNGLRVTTDEVLEVSEMVLNGFINKQIVTRLIKAGGEALGISGIDGGLLQAKSIDESKSLGWVGQVETVNVDLLKKVMDLQIIPVISPIGLDEEGGHYNINADTAAAAIAQSLQAPLCFFSDIPGISVTKNGEKMVLKTVTKKGIQNLIQSGAIYGGMVPKVQAAIESVEHDVPEVVILNGADPHVLVKYLSGEPIGTKIILNGVEENCQLKQLM